MVKRDRRERPPLTDEMFEAALRRLLESGKVVAIQRGQEVIYKAVEHVTEDDTKGAA